MFVFCLFYGVGVVIVVVTKGMTKGMTSSMQIDANNLKEMITRRQLALFPHVFPALSCGADTFAIISHSLRCMSEGEETSVVVVFVCLSFMLLL